MAKIIIVDDEKALLDLVGEFIKEDLGHEVVLCNSGEHAIEELKQSPESLPDLLITDYKMNGITGAELITALHEQGQAMKNILLTGYLEKNIKESLVPFSTICLRKPISLTALENLLAQELGTEATID